jgi:hypothetical protein
MATTSKQSNNNSSAIFSSKKIEHIHCSTQKKKINKHKQCRRVD